MPKTVRIESPGAGAGAADGGAAGTGAAGGIAPNGTAGPAAGTGAGAGAGTTAGAGTAGGTGAWGTPGTAGAARPNIVRCICPLPFAGVPGDAGTGTNGAGAAGPTPAGPGPETGTPPAAEPPTGRGWSVSDRPQATQNGVPSGFCVPQKVQNVMRSGTLTRGFPDSQTCRPRPLTNRAWRSWFYRS